MKAFARLRQWANRDDGWLYRAGNRRLGAIETVGLLLFVAGLFLWQLHAELGIAGAWAYSAGTLGLLLATMGARRPGT